MVAFKYAATALWEEDWVWDELTLEARGITFNSETRECICRPFRKFFNVGQPECNADLSSSFLTEKLDGTCILAYISPDGELACKTLGSFDNEFTKQALPLLRKAFWAPENLAILETDTAIFELLSDIAGSGVIKHTGEPEIVFLGLRDIQTGQLAPRSALKLLSERLNVRLVGHADLTAEAALREAGGDWDGNSEGWVGIDAQQRMFKVKFATYVKLHRFAGSLKSTKHFFERAISLFERWPDQVAHFCDMDDIQAAVNQEISRIEEIVAPLRALDWKAMDRAQKKAKLGKISEELGEKAKELHPLIFCNSDKQRKSIARAMAISNLDRDRHSSSSTD
jgi:hypothetical protein